MDIHSIKILIIEDEQLLMKALTDKLSHEGFSILQATNGQEGLEVAIQEHPNLILLDIIMPIMDGVTMLKKLREDNWGKTAKVIILTNLTDAEALNKSVQNLVFDYLIKADWKLEDLVNKVKERIAE